MKVRAGFVSNSSSSSFMMTFEDKSHALNDIYEIISYIKDNPDKDILILGTELSEGIDAFIPDKEMKDFILENQDRFIDSYENWAGFIDFEELDERNLCLSVRGWDIDSFVLPFDCKEGTAFVSFLRDYSYSRSVEDLKRRYL